MNRVSSKLERFSFRSERISSKIERILFKKERDSFKMERDSSQMKRAQFKLKRASSKKSRSKRKRASFKRKGASFKTKGASSQDDKQNHRNAKRTRTWLHNSMIRSQIGVKRFSFFFDIILIFDFTKCFINPIISNQNSSMSSNIISEAPFFHPENAWILLRFKNNENQFCSLNN